MRNNPDNKPSLILCSPGTINCAALSAPLLIASPSSPPRTLSARKWRGNCCRSYTTWGSSTRRQSSATSTINSPLLPFADDGSRSSWWCPRWPRRSVRWVAFTPRDRLQFCLTRVPSGRKVCRARARQGGSGYDHRPCISRDTVSLSPCSDVNPQADVCRRHNRHMEDFVTWVDTSKLKRTIARYNDEVCMPFFGVLVRY